MWQRFTERARKVVFYAQEEAQKFGEGYVSTEHLLLGLVRESDSVAAALEQYRKRPALGFSDCLILETARKVGHRPLGTFDRNFSKLDGAEGL